MNEHHASSSVSGIGRQLIKSQFNNVFLRFLFYVLSLGPIPNHIAFVMDGNRRYARKKNLDEVAGHKAGFSSLMAMLWYCYKLGVKYVTVYAFRIDNFKRNPRLMYLMLETIETLLLEVSILNEFGVGVYFIGDLRLLNEPVRNAAENIMRATSNNTKFVLLFRVAYTSRDGFDMNNAAEEQEKPMNMSVAPDPNLLIRTSGKTRLSNFLLWRTSKCPLYSPNVLWPEIGLRHLVLGVIIYQRNYGYLKKKNQRC